MPPLKGFSDNPLKSYNDILTATYALITPLIQYQSPGGARIRLPIESGVHFDDTAAQLEGYARPLWAIAGVFSQCEATSTKSDPRLDGWIRGLAAGTDPQSEEYWGDVTDVDQRMVEMEILGFAVLMAPKTLLGDPASSDVAVVKRRANITRYLRSVNGKKFPPTNWLWFRVIANLALVLRCGVPYQELKGSMDADLSILDGFYVGNGWASDGEWSAKNGRQMDYYSGSFAIQYSQLVYARFAETTDPGRCEVFKKRAREFSTEFWRYFSEDGAAIAFGRSLTYRFAMSAFWTAVILANVDLPAPLTPGVVKGLLLRNLRWWSKQPHIFYPDGTLTIGYCFPNMYLAEDYNSPQSPYWCLKSLTMLALPESHSFWTLDEQPHPLTGKDKRRELNAVCLIKQPQQITVDYGNHHFMLSLGQHAGWPMKGGDAKYSKFAYSSAFGYSVPTGPLLAQLALDNTLGISEDRGETWKVRNTFTDETKTEAGRNWWDLPTLSSTWSSSKVAPFSISTTLQLPDSRWPDWHIRVHHIEFDVHYVPYKAYGALGYGVSLIEGGFAVDRTTGTLGRQLAPLTIADSGKGVPIEDHGYLEDASSSFVLSQSGASGIRQLGSMGYPPKGVRGIVLKPDANTNLLAARTMIPTVQKDIWKIMEGQPGKMSSTKLVTAVFAISGKSLTKEEVWKRWLDYPDNKY